MSDNSNHIRTARDTVRNSRGLSQYSFLQLTSEMIHDLIRVERGILNSMKQELALHEAGQLRIRKKGNSEEACYDLQIKKRLGRFADAGIDLSRILFTKEQNEWIDEPFTPNPYNRDSLTTQTSCGIWMRSKSEAIIGTALETIGIPYRNDDLIRIISNGKSGTPFRDTYFADFKVPNFLGGITVHEHFGAFQMENYGDNALQRLNDYHDFAVIEIEGKPVQSNEFTWSFESDIRNAESIKMLIKKLLLPL